MGWAYRFIWPNGMTIFGMQRIEAKIIGGVGGWLVDIAFEQT